jgi:DNA-directed RNA polymerase specialized sigma24 family protein
MSQEIELVHKARCGNKRALERLMNLLIKQKTNSKRASVYSKLELYAFKWSRIVRDWDPEDIVNEMRVCIWKAVMDERGWDEEKSRVSFTVYCWILLKRRIANQLAYEKAGKRGGTTSRMAFDEALEQVLPAVALSCNRPNTELRSDAWFEIEKLKRDLNSDDLLILNLLLRGYQYTEIARFMSTPHNKWNYTKVKTRVRAAIATSTLKECLKR